MWILIKHKIFAYAGLESSKRQQRGCLLEVQAIKLGLLALAITWYWRICGAPQLPLMDCCCYTLIAKSRPAWYNSTQKLNQESWILQMIYQSPHNALAAHEFTPQMPCKAIPNQQLQALLKKKNGMGTNSPKSSVHQSNSSLITNSDFTFIERLLKWERREGLARTSKQFDSSVLFGALVRPIRVNGT